ncbi:hypothetical protein GEMRC1_007585 [Eukaryota sp. GEM-RC1]
MNRLLILFLTFVAITFAGCICPFDCSWGYRHSIADCTCWCQQTALSLGETKPTCSYLPWVPGSPGGCLLCGNTIRSTSAVDPSFENDLANAIVGGSSNTNILFPFKRCTCPYGCSGGYGGTYGQCLDYAKREAHRFLDEKYTVQYMPFGMGSKGGCVVCGKTDPCARF